jgi:hypothetical protein
MKLTNTKLLEGFKQLSNGPRDSLGRNSMYLLASCLFTLPIKKSKCKNNDSSSNSNKQQQEISLLLIMLELSYDLEHRDFAWQEMRKFLNEFC